MKLCPVAIAVGCAKCPLFKVCPVKEIIGDFKPVAGETRDKDTKAAKK